VEELVKTETPRDVVAHLIERLRYLKGKAPTEGLSASEYKQVTKAEELIGKSEHITDLRNKGLSKGLSASEYREIREFEAMLAEFDDNPYRDAISKIDHFRIYIGEHGKPVSLSDMCKAVAEHSTRFRDYRKLYNGGKNMLSKGTLNGYFDDDQAAWVVGLSEWPRNHPIWGNTKGKKWAERL
jgi:hypothetical protein